MTARAVKKNEGRDFHSYTYAAYGHEVMKQPGLFAWQIFDSKINNLLRSEYRIPRITKETGIFLARDDA